MVLVGARKPERELEHAAPDRATVLYPARAAAQIRAVTVVPAPGPPLFGRDASLLGSAQRLETILTNW